jgi:uncharacterized membrane protein
MTEKTTHLRSITKSITWRTLATFTTILIVIIFTGELALALGVGLVELGEKLVLYYVHERAWDRISWGKIIVESEANGS